MRTIVLGAGIAGTLTAYHLLREGHEVTVVDRQPGAGMETSFANGGFMASSQAEPWAAPGVPLKILKWLGHEDAPLLLRPSVVPQMWRWGLRFLANCTEARALASGERSFKLAHYSIAVLKEVREDTQIAYDEVIKGCIRVYGSAEAIDAAAQFYAKLAPLGLNYRVLDAAGCVAIEPALGPSAAKFAGGLFFPDEESGDCHKFTQAIASVCQQGGVAFRYGTNVMALEASGGAISGIVTDKGRLAADRYVLALGSYSPLLVSPLGIRLPIIPVKGYSITVPAASWPGALTVPIADDERKFGLVRPSPDDAGRSAHPRRVALSQPFPQHRPRSHGLDLRLRRRQGRRCGRRRQDAGHRADRVRARPLFEVSRPKHPRAPQGGAT